MDRKHPWYPTIDKIFQFAPDPFLEQEEGFEDIEPPSSALTFYDRHLDPKLTCKTLRNLSSIGPVLSKICDEAFAKFLDDGHSFRNDQWIIMDSRRPTFLSDARSVSKFYGKYMGEISPSFPSKFYFHPESSVWSTLFHVALEAPSREPSRFLSEAALRVNLRARDSSPDPDDILGDALTTNGAIRKLRDIASKYPSIARWNFYPMSVAGRYILKRMHLQASNDFHWETSRTDGCSTVSSTTPPIDAEDGILRRACNIKGKATKPTKRASKLAAAVNQDLAERSPVSQKKASTIKIFRKPLKGVRGRLDPRQYIQHAWATAVDQHSTFVIFNCGIYERIGVRHRESQTLYLSPLFEPINCQNPPYGKLHIGLHIAIIQDLLQRFEREIKMSGDKRSADHLDCREEASNIKRRKYSASEPESDHEYVREVFKVLSQRELALVTLNYGVYLSPVPATFLRLGPSCAHGLHQVFKPTDKSKFSQAEYFELTLGEPMAKGAVGVIHPAALSVTLESGQMLRHDIIVKLAFSEEQQEKLRNEYKIYTHLASAKPVDVIVTVHGLFEDPDSGTLALFMEDGGRSLRWLKLHDPTRYDQLLHEERESFVQALRSLHNAGVRHRDIRPDNILIDDIGKVFIIDFDRAVLDVDTWKPIFKMEISQLGRVLKGEEVYADQTS